MRIVVALGGNALLPRGTAWTADAQQRSVQAAACCIAALAQDHEVVVTHGNGPQVGLLAEQAAARGAAADQPLDVLGAETDGMIGYLLERELRNARPGSTCACLLTQVLVDPTDAAFHAPTKPIGPVYPLGDKARLTAHGWTVAPEGAGVRRVVPSPEPIGVLELDAIETLLQHGHVVICAGGGGVPVRRDDAGVLHGVEAVVDKDLTAQLVASDLRADVLLILTDVSHVMRDWEARTPTPITAITVAEARGLELAAGSMGPKVEAACRFVERGGRRAAIGALADASGLLAETSGTQIRLEN